MADPAVCSSCGAVSGYDGATFCPNCGAPLGAPPGPSRRETLAPEATAMVQDAADRRSRRRPSSTGVLIVAAAVTAVAAVILAIVMTTSSSGKRSAIDGPQPAPSGTTASRSSAGSTASAATAPTSTAPTSTAEGSRPSQTAIADDSLLTAFHHATAADISPYTGAHPNLQFESPSRNIRCLMVDEDGTNGVSCVVGSYDFAQPGPDCDNGATVGLSVAGAPEYRGCATSPYSPGLARVLPYDESLTNGRLGCLAESTGVTCLDLDTGDGFTLSKQSLRLVPGRTLRTVPSGCPSAATLVAAWDRAKAPYTASGASEIACAGTWAVAAVSSGGNAVTGLFRLTDGTWTSIDRVAPCDAHDVPAAIYPESCESN